MLKKVQSHNHAEKEHGNSKSNLWLGFAFGAISATAIGFFLGTKKGRQILKKLLDLSENLEDNAMVLAEQIEEMILEKADKNTDQKQDKPLLGNILEKMKILRN